MGIVQLGAVIAGGVDRVGPDATEPMRELVTGATLVTTSLASNALARVAARSSARRAGSVSS